VTDWARATHLVGEFVTHSNTSGTIRGSAIGGAAGRLEVELGAGVDDLLELPAAEEARRPEELVTPARRLQLHPIRSGDATVNFTSVTSRHIALPRPYGVVEVNERMPL